MRATRYVAVAVTAGAMVLGVMGVTAAALATTGLIVVESVGSPASSAGSLFVTLKATSPVAASSISVSLYAGSGSSPVLTVSDFALTSGSNSGGQVTIWTVTTPITQTQLPLGQYSAAVTASDTGGDHADAPDAGTFAFVIYPDVTLAVTPSTFSLGQTVTLSGTDTGRYPDGTTSPLAGQLIDLLGMDLSTDGAGSFTTTVQAGAGVLGGFLAAPTETAYSAASPTIAAAASNTVKTTVVPIGVEMTGLTVSPTAVSFPGSYAISGDVSYQAGSAYQPFADVPVTVTSLGVSLDAVDSPGFAGTTVTSGSDGSFRAVIPGPIGPDAFTIVPGGAAPPWYTSLAPVTVRTLHLPLRADSGALGTTAGRVQIHACLTPAVPLSTDLYPKAMAAYPAISVQTAKAARGPWATVATARQGSGPPQHVSGCFAPSVRARGMHAYVRVITPATSAYKAFYSPAVKVIPAVRTAIRRFSVSPRSVRRRGRVHVSGRLDLSGQLQSGSYSVQILFRPDGSRKWLVEAQPQANGAVRKFDFSASFTVRRSGRVEARYEASKYTYGSHSGVIRVTVS
jgi:hypothetical protein